MVLLLSLWKLLLPVDLHQDRINAETRGSFRQSQSFRKKSRKRKMIAKVETVFIIIYLLFFSPFPLFSVMFETVVVWHLYTARSLVGSLCVISMGRKHERAPPLYRPVLKPPPIQIHHLGTSGPEKQPETHAIGWKGSEGRVTQQFSLFDHLHQFQ